MNLPWVSRSAYRLLQHNYDELHRLVKEHADARYDRLLEKYHELAQSKHAPPPYVAGLQTITQELADMPTEPRVPSVIAQAIKDEAGGDPKLSRYLWARARELRAENKKPEEIASELRKWLTTEVTE